MLQIKNIRKKYITGELEQIALNDVSLNLRDNEFVAILGQSGSGKTTLLNVIGGLDRYDSGDLIINGISTKDYSDRDWDSYRNHTIGFVFQSYNLIPHQTILSNVELALTISGISGSERRQRAIKALEEVGLGNQLHKKPNQMSGGQMQRVAIARALVNNPDILLADEPTGALDSETSLQVMDLLKEVAKDRLVVMVTHNPELAQQYATRIVRLSDGKIIDDSDPLIIDESNMEKPTHKNMGKASMSFLTSLALSFNNLKTKKGRTFLTSFAGSIGIIGIALILSLSNGVNTYIRNIEEDTLSEYPVTIMSSNFDISSMISISADVDTEQKETDVRERRTISSLFSQTKKNDLKSLKSYIESDKSKIHSYSNAVEYSYSITPQIYRVDEDKYKCVNPNDSFSELNNTYGALSTSMPYNVFYSLPENDTLYKTQYDVLEGRWPENNHELILVLSPDNHVSDIMLYTLGIKDDDELELLMKEFKEGKVTSEVSNAGKYKYSDFVGKKFKLVDVASTYQYDSKRNLYVDKSDDASYMNQVLNDSIDLEIVGIVRKNANSKAGMLSTGILYPFDLQYEVIENAKNSEIVKAQISNPEINVFTGEKFGEGESGFDSLFDIDTSALSSVFSGMSLDSNLFGNIDFSNVNIDLSDLDIDLSGLGNIDFKQLASNITVEISKEGVQDMFEHVLKSYLDYASKDPSTNYQKLPQAIQEYLNSEEAKTILRTNMEAIIANHYQAPTQADMQAFLNDVVGGFEVYMQNYPEAQMSDLSTYLTAYLNQPDVQAKVSAFITGFNISAITQAEIDAMSTAILNGYNTYAAQHNLPDPTKLMDSFNAYIESEAGKQAILDGLNKAVDVEQLKKDLANVLKDAMGQLSGSMEKEINIIMMKLVEQIGSSMGGALGNMTSAFGNLLNFDTSSFSNMFKMDMDEKELQEVMMAMMSGGETSYNGNLTKLNYCDINDPTQILIYPKDFDNKTFIIDELDAYNEKMAKVDQDKVVGFTDYVATLMSSVTDIIDKISYVLIAFVAISLVVSSIMIGIITYISVLERTKEIGILRAIGASKANISQVFNAETFIIGLFAGILGIVTTLLLLIPGNIIIHKITDGNEISAILPWGGAIILIIISVILTMLGGIIPSKAAAKKDPVTALRTE
ncbi:MAG: ABC transporter ATP-binding protein/permease [Holdemanella sp.]|nr:ABC transporter ATP-binding protein/permease [Holdemanella sp.]